MTAATNYLENEFLDHVLGTAAFTAPGQVYVQMHVAGAGEAGTANAAGETTRKAAAFGAASGGTASNSAEIEWTNVSTTETWSHYSIWDAVSGGNAILHGALTVPVSVTAGDDAKFAVGALTVTAA